MSIQPLLYHAPRACSLAVIIAAGEADLPIDILRVDLRTKQLSDGRPYFDIHPLGLVSALQCPNGPLLTETATILAWVQSQSSNTSFRRAPDSDAYFEVLQWINFCATEFHKQLFRIVFYDEATPDVKDRFRDLAASRLTYIDNHLRDRDVLTGDTFSASDAYFTWVITLLPSAGVSIDAYDHIARYKQCMFDRPLVQAAIEADTRP